MELSNNVLLNMREYFVPPKTKGYFSFDCCLTFAIMYVQQVEAKEEKCSQVHSNCSKRTRWRGEEPDKQKQELLKTYRKLQETVGTIGNLQETKETTGNSDN